MISITFFAALVAFLSVNYKVNAQRYGLAHRANSPPYCTSGHCQWNCYSGNCKGMFYCGPNAKSCKLNCPKGACNNEMVLISHSHANTIVNCVGEATCTKLLVVCGDVDPLYIRELNNLPGPIQTMFENVSPQIFQSRKRLRPYGKCHVNCGWKACKDFHYVCQGAFRDYGGCSFLSRGRPSFEDSYFHCGMVNPRSACEANCGAAHITSLNANAFQQMAQDPPCHNSHYFCFRGNCYCSGAGCASIDFARRGRIIYGKAPRRPAPAKGKAKGKGKGKNKSKGKAKGKKKAKAVPQHPLLMHYNNQFFYPRKKAHFRRAAPKRTIRVFTHHDVEPIKPDFLVGQYTHLRCGTENCKVLCERVNSCAGLTILASISVRHLVVECAQEGCVNLKVLSLAQENHFKCVDHGACAGANFQCGLQKKEPKRQQNAFSQYGQQMRLGQPFIKMCHVECANGGCSKHHNPANNFRQVSGLKVTCNKEVQQCELHSDSQNSRVQYNNSPRLNNPMYYTHAFGRVLKKPVNRSPFPNGSFDKGEFNCNVRKFPNFQPQQPAPQQQSPWNARGLLFGNINFGYQQQPNYNMGSMPTCVLKCSTHIFNKFCGGVKYTCGANRAQCQCEDFCSSHQQECLAKRLRGDCPRAVMIRHKAKKAANKKKKSATKKKATKKKAFNEKQAAANNKKTVTP